MSNTTTLTSGTVISTAAGQRDLAERKAQQTAVLLHTAREAGDTAAAAHHQRVLDDVLGIIDALTLDDVETRGF